MKRFSEFSFSAGYDALEARLSLTTTSLFYFAPPSDPGLGALIPDDGLGDGEEPEGDPYVPDPDPNAPSYPAPPPEGDPGPFPGSPPPPIFPMPPIGGPIGPG
jgi:hypothetical protein